MVQFALDHDIHLIQLPSKSTHELQPLDVGCFALLQISYERQLRDWLLENPLSVIRKVDFLDLLFKARTETYTIDTVKNAWRASGCWPINLDKAHGVPDVSLAAESEPAVRALDTPLLIRKLAREAEEQRVSDLDKGTKRSLFQAFVDTTTAKLTTYVLGRSWQSAGRGRHTQTGIFGMPATAGILFATRGTAGHGRHTHCAAHGRYPYFPRGMTRWVFLIYFTIDSLFPNT